MSLIKRMRKRYAAYWPPLKPDADGNPRYGTPIELRCRWEQTSEDYIDPEGVRQFNNAKVFVDRDLVSGGLLCLGRLDAILYPTQPFKNEGVGEITKVDKLPNLRNTEELITVFLRFATARH